MTIYFQSKSIFNKFKLVTDVQNILYMLILNYEVKNKTKQVSQKIIKGVLNLHLKHFQYSLVLTCHVAEVINNIIYKNKVK